ncbi:DUF659 domain-containing protein [Mycena venus]|uniref:DUF659 domain-containing protein n=1 Tax=Mycena venus TaxID=2733690 RepID=A0A8H7CVJ0_9AGAR|nr:DUF659 domain-containing protein [Mycena venus]
MAGGRPADKLLDANFTRLERAGEKSNRYFWKCNHCDTPGGAHIEGRDQRPIKHLIDCPSAPASVRQAGHLHLIAKGNIPVVSSGSILPEAATSEKPSAASGESEPRKKRKGRGTLDGYVDYAMTPAQKADADVKFFRFIVHSNSSFRTAHNPYLISWVQSIRPTYEVPSRYVLSGRLLRGENSRVHLEEVERLKGRKMVTLLLDGWDDALHRSLYGSLAAGVGEYPTVLGLDDLTGNRGSADKYLETMTGAMKKMDIAGGKNVIALTTDNPTVMQSFRRKFQLAFPWVLVSIRMNTVTAIFACFLHGLNTIIGKIVAYPAFKKFITATAAIVSFFNSSHYWGGQLEEEAKAFKIGRSLKTRTESRWYSLILQALSVVAHLHRYQWVMDIEYWDRLKQIIRICKPLVDAIGNLEAREVNLADCMLELLRCARHLSSVSLERSPSDDWGFIDHARMTFMNEFHEMNTKIHALACSFIPAAMCETAGKIAKMWKWDSKQAGMLMEDLQQYYLCKGVFAGGTADAKEWWEGLPISGSKNPLKTLAVVLFSVVPHAAEVERLFSGLSRIQGVKRCNFTVPTFEALGKLRNNYSYHIYQRDRAAGVAVHRKHGHMHTRAEPGIDTDFADDLQAAFTWQPPLIVETITDDVNMHIEDFTPEQIEAELANWEADLAAEQAARDAVPMNREPDEVSLVYDLAELKRIDSGPHQLPKMMSKSIWGVGKQRHGTWQLSLSPKPTLTAEACWKW